MVDRITETLERERRFTADAAHELRTPLAALETSIDVTLSQPRARTEYAETLTVMRAQTARLSSLTRQLLMLSRMDNAQVEGAFERIEVAPFLDAVVESFRDAHPAAALTVHVRAEALAVSGSVELLARAFVNILENAILHGSPRANILLTVEAVAATAVITIHDDGPGIPVGLREFVFQRFRRGDEARSTLGSGLGLAIAEAVVRAHGGSTRLAAVDTGTAVEVTLPVIR